MPRISHAADRRHIELTRRAIRLVRDGHAHASAGELARTLGVSEAHLRQVFARRSGRKLGQHQALIRLTRAAHALCHRRWPIVRIALDAGYANHESFTRAFRTAFGLTPRDYRRQIASRNPPVEPTTDRFSLSFVKILCA